MSRSVRPTSVTPKDFGFARTPDRVVIALFVALLCALMVAGVVWQATASQAAQLAAARIQVANLAASLAQQSEAAFDTVDMLLSAVMDRMQSDGAGPGALAGLRHWLVGRAAALPQLADVTVVGEDGALLAGSWTGAPADAAAGRALVAFHRAHAEPGARVGAPQRSLRDGRMVVTLSRRFDHPDGTFAGAVQASIDLAWFADSFSRLTLDHGVVALWRNDGTVLVQQPEGEAPAGAAIDMARWPTYAAGNGVSEVRAADDGLVRIIAYQHLRRYPVILFHGIARRDALAEWWFSMEALAGGMALLLALVALGARGVVWHLGRLHRAERSYRLLADHCADVVFTLDPAWRVQYASPSLLDGWGFAPGEVVGTRLLRHVHPDDRGPVAAVYQAVASGQEGARVLHRLRHKADYWVWVEVELRRVQAADGAAAGIIGAARDVTAHKMAEDALQAEQAFLQAVFEYSTDCLFVQRVLPEGGFAIERINAAAANSLGIAAKDAIGRSPAVLFGDAYGAAADSGLRQTLAARQGLWVENRGDGLTWEVTEVPIPGAGGAIERILVNARNVTEQKRAREAQLMLRASEEERRLAAEATSERLDRLAGHLARARDRAEQANEAKSRFLTSMSHELRTPLNGILGYAQLLQMEGGLRPSQAGYVEAMLVAGRHLLEMITSVLDMGQIEADKLTLQSSAVNLADLTHACLGLVRPIADSKGLALLFAAAPDTPARLQADSLRLRQVLLNLLGNAVKFTSEGSVEVRILGTGDGATVRVEVADTGPGIPAEERARLFGAFERMDGANATPVEGAGLGLAISARLVAAMGGCIGCDAGPDGAGSVFWFELPALREGEDANAEAPAPRQAAGPRRLLVVDDGADNRDIAAAFLRSAGHRVTTASSGEAALRAARTKDYDVILMDVRMPGMDGLEASRRIRALPGPRGRVPIVAVTAQAFAEQIQKCREAGMDRHLSKPYEIGALLAAVDDALGGDVPAVAAEPGAAGADMPVLDRPVFDSTAAYLTPEEMEGHVRALAERGRALQAALAAGLDMDETAELAHSMAGAAGTFGFRQIAELGRRFEYAAATGAAETADLAEALAVSAAATVAVLDALSVTPAALSA